DRPRKTATPRKPTPEPAAKPQPYGGHCSNRRSGPPVCFREAGGWLNDPLRLMLPATFLLVSNAGRDTRFSVLSREGVVSSACAFASPTTPPPYEYCEVAW